MNNTSLFLAELETVTLNDIEGFCCINAPPDQRVKEGTRVDYKRDLPKDLGKTISAMANTSGGLIIIGVEENQGVPTKIDGISLGQGDIKTRITNIAYSTIDPPLTPEVGFCSLQKGTSQGVVVVRVQMSRNTPHMYIKDDENTICVRENDRLARADLETINRLYERRNQAVEELKGTLSREGNFVGLNNWQNGFRTLAIVPEFPSECRIPFQRDTDLYFERTKPDAISGELFRDRNQIAFVRQKQNAEQRFSISEGGILHYSETIGMDEAVYSVDPAQGAVRLGSIEAVLTMVLPYAKTVLNHFGYFGSVHIVYRLGRIQGKFLSSWNNLPLSPRGHNVSARCDEISIERRLSLDEIAQGLDEVVTSILQEICRGAFGFNLEEQWRQ